MTNDDRRDELTALLDAAVPRDLIESDAIRGLRRVTPESQIDLLWRLLSSLDRGDDLGVRAYLNALRRIADGWPTFDDSTYIEESVEDFNARFGIR